MKRWLSLLVLLLVAALLGPACSSGYAYGDVSVDLPVAGTDTVTVATLDQREAVAKQGRDPSFVGMFQESQGSSQTVTTKSGSPLAQDISRVVQRSLETAGFSVQALELAAGTSEEQAFQQLRSTGQKHLVLIVIKRWDSETDKNTELYFDLSLAVYNAAGALKGKSLTEGTDQFAQSGASSFDEVEAVLTGALGHKLSILFSEPKIQEAFRREL